MTNAELLAKIKAEIERRYNYEKEMYCDTKPDGRPNDGWAESLAIMGVLEELLSFLSTLENRSTRQRLAEWSKTPEGKESYEKVAEEMRKQIVPNDLEEAAKKHSCYDEDCEGVWYEPIVRNAFIAGAKWQKEQMMKGAKDGYVSAIIIHNNGDEEHYAVTYPNGERPHSITDKVKIIIL